MFLSLILISPWDCRPIVANICFINFLCMSPMSDPDKNGTHLLLQSYSSSGVCYFHTWYWIPKHYKEATKRSLSNNWEHFFFSFFCSTPSVLKTVPCLRLSFTSLNRFFFFSNCFVICILGYWNTLGNKINFLNWFLFSNEEGKRDNKNI